MYRVVFIKNGQVHNVPASRFWELASLRFFAGTDLIFDPASCKFLPASEFSDLHPYLPHQDWLSEVIGGVIKLTAVFIGIGLLAEALTPPPTPRRRRPRPNYTPLEPWKKAFVRERDDSRCNYCGRRVTSGHVDHKTSRVNGGSNRLNNLCWACAPCNLSKGGMNAHEFRRRIASL